MKNIICLVLITFCFTNYSLGQTQEVKTSPTQIENVKPSKTTLKVKGATCSRDLGMIVANIKKVEGVEECTVLKHGAVTTIEVAYNEKQTDTEKIQNAVLTTGTCENPDERRYKVKI